MFCTECGAKNSADNKFCRQCGHSLEKARISEEAYTRALPEDEQAIELLEAAYALHKKGDMIGAAQTCERALQIAPDSAAAHSLLGQLYAAQGDRERAIGEYEQVLRLNPGSIADRVKLDELRDEGQPKTKRAASILPISARDKAKRAVSALPISARENVAPSMLTLVSIGAAMIALTAAGVALNRAAHSDTASKGSAANRTGAANPAASNPASVSNASAIESVAPPTGDTKLTTAQGAAAAPTKTASLFPNAFGPEAALPAIKTNPSAFPPPGPPTTTLPAIDPSPAAPAVKRKPKKSDAKKTTADAPSDNRIVLSGEDGGAGGSDHYIIKINAGGVNNSGGSGKNNVVMAHNGGGAEDPPAPSSRSAVSIADDFRYKGEYDKAIQMYQRALPGAGDGAAHIYQQMAYCFQAKGDKSSAKVNYERAIEAYQKLAQSGQNAESAQSAIRVCQRGIKVCE